LQHVLELGVLLQDLRATTPRSHAQSSCDEEDDGDDDDDDDDDDGPRCQM
jgi:hypothetical protein